MTTNDIKSKYVTIPSVVDMGVRIPNPRKVKFPLFNIGDRCPICAKLVRDLMIHAKEQMDPEHIIYMIHNS